MLTFERTRTIAQSMEVNRAWALVDRANALLGDREARVFPPDRLVNCWQIFLRHSTITTEAHDSFADAARDLIGQLESEARRLAA